MVDPVYNETRIGVCRSRFAIALRHSPIARKTLSFAQDEKDD